MPPTPSWEPPCGNRRPGSSATAACNAPLLCCSRTGCLRRSCTVFLRSGELEKAMGQFAAGLSCRTDPFRSRIGMPPSPISGKALVFVSRPGASVQHSRPAARPQGRKATAKLPPSFARGIRLRPDYAEVHRILGWCWRRPIRTNRAGSFSRSDPPAAELCRGAREPGAALFRRMVNKLFASWRRDLSLEGRFGEGAVQSGGQSLRRESEVLGSTKAI